MSSCQHLEGEFTVQSKNCQYNADIIISDYTYETTIVEGNVVKPVESKMKFRTERKVPKLGVMLVGLGGNNGWYV
jgi:myo-inositol-1-phosphate synthase